MVPCGSGDINVFFQNCLHTDTFFSPSPSLRRPLPVCRDRAAAAGVPRPIAASPLEALPAAVHFLVGWMEPGGSARGGGAAGQSPPGAWGDQLAGGRVPNAAAALAAAPPPLRVAGRSGGRDNVAGLVAGRRLPSHLKWVPPGCCLAGRRGDQGGGGGSAPLGQHCQRRPESLLFLRLGHGVQGLGAGDSFSAPGFFSLRKCKKHFPRMMAFASPRTQHLNF